MAQPDLMYPVCVTCEVIAPFPHTDNASQVEGFLYLHPSPEHNVVPMMMKTVCICGHDGKLTSLDCPIHGVNRTPPPTVTAIGVTSEPRGAHFSRVDNGKPPVFDDVDSE